MKYKIGNTDILEIWESFNGDLYFISEHLENDEIFCYARLYSMPDCAEWGYNNLEYLKGVYGPHKLWKVDKKHWDNINTYEKGLLKAVVV